MKKRAGTTRDERGVVHLERKQEIDSYIAPGHKDVFHLGDICEYYG